MTRAFKIHANTHSSSGTKGSCTVIQVKATLLIVGERGIITILVTMLII